MNWRSASSRSTPDTAVEVDDRAAVHLPELLGIELGQKLLERRADQRFAVREHDARVLRVGLEVEDVGRRG